MILSSLRLISFRNHLDSLLDTRKRKVVFLEGPNGAGKTSVLEAIHLMATGIGFRTRRDADFARFGAEGYRIDLRCDEFDAAIRHKEGSRREAFLRQAPLPKWTDLIGRIRMTVLKPDDLAIIEDGPAERRRYLDIMLSQKDRSYFDALRRWKRAAKQLHRGATRYSSSRSGSAVSASFATLVAAELPRIFESRDRCCSRLADSVKSLQEELALPGILGLEYRPAVPGKWEPGDWETAAKNCFRESRRCEAMGQPSPWGPGRDDVAVTLDGVLLRQFGSQGQKRLASLVLRLAEARFLTSDDQSPLVLVDDVLGELDRDRKNAFLGLLGGVSGQIWLADTATKYYEERFQNWAKFDIKSGTLQGAIYP